MKLSQANLLQVEWGYYYFLYIIYVSCVLANIITESSLLLPEMMQKLRTQIIHNCMPEVLDMVLLSISFQKVLVWPLWAVVASQSGF
jgi:hypothetical protein